MRGEVSLRDLRDYASRSQQKLVYSEHGLTREDVAAISRRARQAGVPVSFSRPGDRKTFYPAVLEADLPLFRQIVQARIAEKLNSDRKKAVGDREYSQIAVKKWEIPIIAKECQRRDIQASFAPHPNDPNLAVVIYPTADKAGIPYMAALLRHTFEEQGISPADGMKMLVSDLLENGVIFRDPEKVAADDPESGYVDRAEYLSGNVRRKLAMAEAAAQTEPEYLRNTESAWK